MAKLQPPRLTHLVQCPPGHYYDEFATAGEPVFKPYQTVDFTGPRAPFTWRDVVENAAGVGAARRFDIDRQPASSHRRRLSPVEFGE